MTEPATLGAYLRAARRRRRVSIERAAEDTRIRADFLMRMESDEFDFLAPAYVRSFLKNYARYLRIQPEPMLEEFDRSHGRTKLDTAQIIALEKRAKASTPRKRLSSWATAAVIAVVIMGGLSAIGLVNSPEEDPARDRSVALGEPTPEASEEPDESATPSPTPAPEESVIAFDDGIDLEVVASKGRCWLEVYSDGETLYYATLQQGDSESFFADRKMF
ncbi:MAG: RodZ domain-containing protein, partial [Actinomycetota bacterium]